MLKFFTILMIIPFGDGQPRRQDVEVDSVESCQEIGRQFLMPGPTRYNAREILAACSVVDPNTPAKLD